MAVRTDGGLIKTSMVFHPEQLARLDQIARARHISRSAIMREALDEKLARLTGGGPVLEPERVA